MNISFNNNKLKKKKKPLKKKQFIFYLKKKLKKNKPIDFIKLKIKKKKPSKFGLLLNSKQNLKKRYGKIREKYLKTQIIKFNKSKIKKKQIAFNLLTHFEFRLDIIIFRMQFASSINEARQLINHGYIYVNNNKILSPSKQLNSGDFISINKNKKKNFKQKLLKSNICKKFNLLLFKKNKFKKSSTQIFYNLFVNSYLIYPNYLEINYNTLEGLILYKPPFNEIYSKFLDFTSIIEYYRSIKKIK